MPSNKNSNIYQLKNWLLNKPLFFALFSFVCGTVLFYGCAFIQSIFGFETMLPVSLAAIFTFVGATYYTIKKLPHDKINQNDFIAITNGATLISVLTAFVAISVVNLYGTRFTMNLMLFYMAHKTVFFILFLLLLLFSLYLVGVAICNIYAKYKRAQTIGITPWKIILTMPFTFLLMWTPGYLIKGKDTKGNLKIKCQWYSKLQNWVMNSYSNILFMFLFLLLCRGIVAGLATFTLYVLLLVLYTLWYVKHKEDFMKNIDGGYTTTAIGINLVIIITIILTQIQ